MTLRGDLVLNPAPECLESVLRCLTCQDIVADGAGPLEGEEADQWLTTHLRESPSCKVGAA